jgi:hypothetical protein
MEALINLDTKPRSDQASLLLRQPASIWEKLVAILTGAGIGFGLAMVPVVFLLSFLSQSEDFGGDAWISWMKNLLPLLVSVLIVGLVIGALLVLRKLAIECRKGFLRVDTDQFQYWNRKNNVSGAMEKLFGAGPEGKGEGREFRLCYVSDGPGGYDTDDWNFGRYEVVEGPLTGMDAEESDGNTQARQVFLYYINKRRDAGMPVAELPPYAFESVKGHRDFLVIGPLVVDYTFKCDGKTITWTQGDRIFTVPVIAVREVTVDYRSGRGGPTRWIITLVSDPSYGNEVLYFDIRNMSYAEEVERYCRCLPALFD